MSKVFSTMMLPVLASSMLCSSAFAAADVINAEDNSNLSFITGVRLGVSMMKDDFGSFNYFEVDSPALGKLTVSDDYYIDDNSFTIRPYLGLQYNFNQTIGLRGEAEYFYIDDTSLEGDGFVNGKAVSHTNEEFYLQGFFVNGVAVFFPENIVAPYLGVGVGHTWASYHRGPNDYRKVPDDNSGSYNLFAGLNINCSKYIGLDLQARYSQYFSDVYSTDIMGGIKFAF